MKYQEFIDLVADKAGFTKKDAKKSAEAVFEVLSEIIEQGESQLIPGFGTFSLSTRAARVGRNPRTGDEIEIPATNTPKFKPSKALKERLQ